MYLERLSDKIWNTKNARFCASRRMKRSKTASAAAIALLSASTISINLLVYLPGIRENEFGEEVSIATIILSTFTLVLSLLVSILRYEDRERNYHSCGMDLTDLNDRLQIEIEEIKTRNAEVTPTTLIEQNRSYLKKYNDILKKYNLNHTTFDYIYSSSDQKEMTCWPCKKNLSSSNNTNYNSTKKEKICWLCKIWLEIRWYVFDISVLY